MQYVASYAGKRGEILILEERATGTLCYFENGAFQAHATRGGISQFGYVHLMAELLKPACKVLLLGCASGSLATMLTGAERQIVVVDDNPLSFDIARNLFGLPATVDCVLADFRDFLDASAPEFDAVGVDIAARHIDFASVFDLPTCRSITGVLSGAGRVVMNIVADNDADLVPDSVLAQLCGQDLHGWIFDQPGEIDRNCILLASSIERPNLMACLQTVDSHPEHINWGLRGQRLFFNQAEGENLQEVERQQKIGLPLVR